MSNHNVIHIMSVQIKACFLFLCFPDTICKCSLGTGTSLAGDAADPDPAAAATPAFPTRVPPGVKRQRGSVCAAAGEEPSARGHRGCRQRGVPNTRGMPYPGVIYPRIARTPGKTPGRVTMRRREQEGKKRNLTPKTQSK